MEKGIMSRWRDFWSRMRKRHETSGISASVGGATGVTPAGQTMTAAGDSAIEEARHELPGNENRGEKFPGQRVRKAG